MSTAALAGIKKEDGSIDYIYNHYDSYVEGGLGDWLLDNVTETEDVEHIISLGDASSIEWNEFYTARGEALKISNAPNEEMFLLQLGSIEYLYLWNEDHWEYASLACRNQFTELLG